MAPGENTRRWKKRTLGGATLFVPRVLDAQLGDRPNTARLKLFSAPNSDRPRFVRFLSPPWADCMVTGLRLPNWNSKTMVENPFRPSFKSKKQVELPESST